MRKEVFVFGSNLAGIHGKGAALFAREHYGARIGVGNGPTGDAYALPTKDAQLTPLPLVEIDRHVSAFCRYASAYKNMIFLVTPFGTGLAGHPKSEIWKMLKKRKMPENCFLTSSWL